MAFVNQKSDHLLGWGIAWRPAVCSPCSSYTSGTERKTCFQWFVPHLIFHSCSMILRPVWMFSQDKSLQPPGSLLHLLCFVSVLQDSLTVYCFSGPCSSLAQENVVFGWTERYLSDVKTSVRRAVRIWQNIAANAEALVIFWGFPASDVWWKQGSWKHVILHYSHNARGMLCIQEYWPQQLKLKTAYHLEKSGEDTSCFWTIPKCALGCDSGVCWPSWDVKLQPGPWCDDKNCMESTRVYICCTVQM